MAEVDSDIFALTAKRFDDINFDQIDDDYLNLMWNVDFTDVEDNPMTVSVLFVQDTLVSLRNLAEVCELWHKSEVEKSKSSNFETTLQDEVLWSYLESLNVSVKQILGVIYILCSKALKPKSGVEEKEIGLAGAKFYFACLRLTGAEAYQLVHSNLYKLCIDCLQMPDLTREMPPDTLKDFEELLPGMVSTLNSLVPLFDSFALGSHEDMMEHTIKKLVDLTGCELSLTNLNFDIDYLNLKEKTSRHYKLSFVVTSLAYQGLLSLVRSNLRGDKDDENYSIVLAHLIKHILCSKVKKSTGIPQRFLVIKQNAVSFICYNLTKNRSLYSKASQNALKSLCMNVKDKAEFRSTVAQAILTIMPHLKVEDFTEMVQWLLILGDSSEVTQRSFAVDVLGELLTFSPQFDSTDLCSSLKVYLTSAPIAFSILTRCDDVSPVIRAKALSVLSEHMKIILDILSEYKEHLNLLHEEWDTDIAPDVGFNGENRFYWYNFSSYRTILDEIATILYRGIEDNNANSRKAALLALESLVTFDLTYLCEDNLKRFLFAAKDPAVVIRKQVVPCVTSVLNTYYTNSEAQQCWMKCVFPLVLDAESTVQAKALGVLEDQFLNKIISSSVNERDCAFSLLKMLYSGEFMSHQGFLKKAFSTWKSEKKLKLQIITQLEKVLGDCRNECFWFYVSFFAAYSKLPTNTCIFAVEEFEKCNQSSWNSTFIEHILKVLGCIFDTLPLEKLEIIKRILQEKLQAFDVPVEFLPKSVEVLYNIYKHLKGEKEFARFSEEIIETAMSYLSPFVLHEKLNSRPSEKLLINCMSTVKEFCHIFPANLTEKVTHVFKSCVKKPPSRSPSIVERITPTLQAHAFAALGKMCLQDKVLAEELLPILATNLMTAEEGKIRNNVALIMIQMCKLYTGFADKYVPLITSCFKDQLYIIRYQSVLLLVSLLQEDYIKWKGHLFFCLVSTIIDKNEPIQELGKYCLCQMLLEKNASIFEEHFVDCIFVFNHYAPPDNKKLSQMVERLKRFAVKGKQGRQNRLQLYKFMLEYMSVAYRAILTTQLCREILLSVAENVFPLNAVTESIVRDCFAIISSEEIRVCNVDHIPEDLEEADEVRIVNAELNTRRITVIDPLIPVIISLKNCAMHGKSGLQKDIVLFLKDILQDFKSDVPQILAADKILLMQVQMEFENEMMRQERAAKEKKKASEKNVKQKPSPPRGHQIAKIAMETTKYIIEQERKSLGTLGSNAVINEESGYLLLLPRTPQNKRITKKRITEGHDSQMPSQSSKNDHNRSSCETSHADSVAMMKQLSSTPKVVLTALRSLTPNVCNISEIAANRDDNALDSEG